jgi:metal-responsive CopG/Arc/MetJ family transcriptional regulator
MFGPKIKLEKDLFERCKEYAKEAGYGSVEEFITHTLEKELRNKEKKSREGEEEVIKRLKGLGYIE